MTLAAEYVRVDFTGTGSVGPFAIPFRFEANSHIKVARRATSGTVTTLTEGVDYTLTGGPEAGQVTLSTALAAAAGSTPAEVIEIYRERPLSQNTALGVNSAYRSTVIEAALDEGRQIDQDLDAKISRSLRAPPTENVSMVLPSKQSRAGALLGFNAAGEPIPIDPDTLDAMGDGDPLGVTPVNAGGTGATTEAEARTNLGIGAVGTLDSIGSSDIAAAHAATSHASIISADLIANNAARLRDLGVWVVESATVTTPPAVTNEHAYLVPLDATGDWASQTGNIAYGESGAWTYKTAGKGWNAIAKDTDIEWYHDGSAWGPTAGTGSGTGSGTLSTQDARVAGFATVNSQGGGAKFRVHWTVDQRIVVFGDQSAFGFDPAGDSWGRFEIAIPWDIATISIEAIYAGLNYILVQTNQSTGNLWQWDATAKALVRVQKFIDDAVRIADVVTEANLGNTETFWFARTTANTGYGWGYSGAQHVMGYGSTTNLTTPRKLTYSDGTTPVTNIASFSVSTAYAPIWCRLSTGVALRWGAGTDGAHGNNNTTAIQWPTALETAVGSGISRTDIAQIAVTGSNIVTARAVTWLLTTAGKIEASGSRYHGNGDGSALTSAAINTFQAASGAIASLTATAIVAGGGEAPIAIALLSTGNAMMCGYQSGVPLLGGGVTTNLTVFTALTGLPSGFAGAITAARICGGDGTGNTQAAYLQATISGVKTLASIGYDTVYATGKNTGSTSAGSQVWGLVLGGRGTISSWQAVGSNTVYGIEVLNSDGELRYAGGNDQGQGGVQVGNLHSIPILQPCMSGPRMVKPPTWRGAYSAGTSYTERDLVELNGSAWINVLASTGVSPPTMPTTANSNWQLFTSIGNTGSAATVAVGTTTTVTPAVGPSVTNAGSSSAADLRFSLPRASNLSIGTITTGAAGSSASVTPTTDGNGDVSLAMSIPRGDTGAASTVPGPGYGGTSTTSLTIGTGTKSLTTQSGLAYALAGSRVRLSSAANSNNYMEGIAAYTVGAGAMTVVVSLTGGSGTFSDWQLSLAGEPGSGILPAGGTTSQVLAKNSSTAGDASWQTITTGGLPGHYKASDYGVLPNGSDMTSALSSMLTTLSASGTKGFVVVFDDGVYRFDGQITLPYDGVSANPKGGPIRFLGAGEWWSGKSTASAANGGTIFDCRYSGSNAWLMALYEGTFTCNHITFSQRGGTAHTTPYMKFTNTTPQISECSFEGHSTKAAATADQDCIILGGTDNSSFGSDGVNKPFQGYGAVIERCNFNRIRCGIRCQVYANGIVIQNNNFWAQCGDGGGAYGAIEYNSTTADLCVGGLVSGNLIECVGYVSPIRVTRGGQLNFIANSFYDHLGPTTPGYILLTNCSNIGVVGGAFNDIHGPYVGDAAGNQTAFVIVNGSTTASSFKFITAGAAGYPNNLSYTTFNTLGALICQPTLPVSSTGDGKFLRFLRSASEVSDPGAEVFSMTVSGQIAWGNASAPQQGNITTTLASATSWSNNGRKWACNGSGGNMEINSGTGGSMLQLKNYGVEFYNQSGTFQGRWGGALGAGIAYGASADAEWSRHASVAMMRSNVPIRGGEYTVATLPTASSSYRGARAHVTDATSPTFLGALTGGGAVVAPVFCNGSAWVSG